MQGGIISELNKTHHQMKKTTLAKDKISDRQDNKAITSEQIPGPESRPPARATLKKQNDASDENKIIL